MNILQNQPYAIKPEIKNRLLGQHQATPTNDPEPNSKELRLKKTCQEFEAVFVGMMLKTMRSTIEKDGIFKDSLQQDMFQSLFDQNLSSQISKGNGIGISDMLYDQLTGDRLKSPQDADKNNGEF